MIDIFVSFSVSFSLLVEDSFGEEECLEDLLDFLDIFGEEEEECSFDRIGLFIIDAVSTGKSNTIVLVGKGDDKGAWTGNIGFLL